MASALESLTRLPGSLPVTNRVLDGFILVSGRVFTQLISPD
jgi:hypothetical protein